MLYVGENIDRRDGWSKCTGQARYVDDLSFPGMLHGVTVRSTVAPARILGIRFDPAFDWTGITRVQARDIPGDNVIQLFRDDQPCLAADRTQHLHEPVVLLAAADPARVRDAARHVEIEYEPVPGVYTLEEAEQALHHVGGDEHNILDQIRMARGDVAAAFTAADHLVTGEYRTGPQEHLYLETQGILARPRAGGGVQVYGSLQCPYFVLRALRRVLRLEAEQLEIIQAVTGGAFGGKEEYPSLPAAHAALLALAADAPVKLIYDRHEDLLATTKRHPARIRLQHAVRRDGTILGLTGTFDIDGGAYITLSRVVLSRGLIHLPGPYRVPAIDLTGRIYATHTVPNGAFRGFGAPQATFAYESQLNRIARVCGLDPLEVRRRNLLRLGDETATGMRLSSSVGVQECLARVLTESDYVARRRQLREAPPVGPRRRGLGLSVFLHGAGFTGSGEARIKGRADVSIEPGGRFRIRAGTVEMGQGMRTTFPQIAAETLGVPLDAIFVGATNTQEVPDSGPTVASRTAMVIGRVVREACLRLKAALLEWGAAQGLATTELQELARAHLERTGPLAAHWVYELPPGIEWDDARHLGDAYPVYAWSAEVAEVTVDTDTGEVQVERIVNATDVGRALHPRIVLGQIEGGTLQGVGWTYGEQAVSVRGRLLQDRLATYIIPTVEDTPELEVHLVEEPFAHGPFGAKGVGEMPLDGVAPAITLALEEALGITLDTLPVTPEHLLGAITAVQSKER